MKARVKMDRKLSYLVQHSAARWSTEHNILFSRCTAERSHAWQSRSVQLGHLIADPGKGFGPGFSLCLSGLQAVHRGWVQGWSADSFVVKALCFFNIRVKNMRFFAP